MAWSGYLTLGGTEIVNSARTAAYAKSAPWFQPSKNLRTPELASLLGQGSYVSPLADGAPWVDPDDADTLDFWGCYPLSITGLEDSTRSSDPVESIVDGGRAGLLRHTTKAVVCQVLLVGATEAAVEAGFQWLKEALLGGACGQTLMGVCGGDTLCYLGATPAWTINCRTRKTGLDLRSLLQVVVNSGPRIEAKSTLSSGTAWTVSFTAVAGLPWEYGPDVPVIANFGSGSDPYVGGKPTGVAYDDLGAPFAEPACATPAYSPVFDPLYPAVIVPPSVPQLPLASGPLPTSWTRRQFQLPASVVPLWESVVPTITVKAFTAGVRNLRIRFYADPLGAGDPNSSPCDFCVDLVVSYVPLNGTLTFDAVQKIVYLDSNGQRRRADSLVYSTDGTPFEWPELTCGTGYVVTFDSPVGAIMPTIDMSFTARSA